MIKFFKKHFSEITFALTIFVSVCVIIYIVTLGTTYTGSIREQATKRSEFYTEEQSRRIREELDKMTLETEFFSSKISGCESEAEFKDTINDIKFIESNENNDILNIYYVKDDKIYTWNEEEENSYTELSELKKSDTMKFSRLFQYENHVMSIAAISEVENCAFADKFIVLFDRVPLQISSYSNEVTSKDSYSEAEFIFLSKHDGRIFDYVNNTNRFDVKNSTVRKDVFGKIFNDNDTIEKAYDALFDGKVSSFLFSVSNDDYILSIDSFGVDYGNISVVAAYKVKTIYSEGFELSQAIWSSMLGLALIAIILVLSIIFQRFTSNKKIFRLEMIDSSLNCSTPKKFEKDVAEIIKKHPGSSFAFVSVRINNFGYFSQKLGDAETNKLARYAASVIRQAVSVGETYAYAGEGEFLMFLHYKDRQNFTERLSSDVYSRLSLFRCESDDEYKPSLSFAVYEIEKDEKQSVKEMLNKLKMVKETASAKVGVFCIDFYEDMLRENYIRKAEIESRMESALENSEFHLFYQPKYNLKNKNMDGSEILIRWYDPKIEQYRVPDEFLPVFEENGFINKIDRFVMYKACENIAARIEKRQICYPVSVNVSRVTATQPDFTEYYIRIKNKFNIKDNFITIEFTESFAYENYEYISSIVSTLHENGFLCSIDDFGTGYSSYNILKSIKMDEIKLDKFFLSKGISEERDQTLLKSVIEMVNKLGMKVTQEGVETKEDVERLQELGCDVIQGYYFAKPMKYVDYLEFIDTNFIKK